jgi:ribosomal protein S8
MLTRIRNASSAKHTRVDMPASRLKTEIARILQDEGYIQGFKLLDEASAPNAAQTKGGSVRSAAPVVASTSARLMCRTCSAASAPAFSPPRAAS